MSPSLRELFTEVAPTYDLANHILTLGLDIIWRRAAARTAASVGGRAWLDMGSGPGEMARALARRAPEGTLIVGADFTPAMMRASRDKSSRARVLFVAAEAGRLPFPDGTFDLVTISFATRNINTSRELLVARLGEFRRVLKPRGVLVNLETSQPPSPVVRRLYHAFIRLLVERVGALLSGSRPAYAYLGSTIPRFYDAPSLAGIMREAGFSRVEFRRLMLGAAAIHTATKS